MAVVPAPCGSTRAIRSTGFGVGSGSNRPTLPRLIQSDWSCAGPWELDGLDPASLDDHRLVEAVASAVGLRDDARTAALTAELFRRRPREAAALDLAAAVSALIRRALSGDDFDAALRWIEQARPLGDARTAATLDRWRAEILSRAGRPDEALSVYRALIRSDVPVAGAALALDGGETLLDNGYLDQAHSLLVAPPAPLAAAGSSAALESSSTIPDREDKNGMTSSVILHEEPAP